MHFLSAEDRVRFLRLPQASNKTLVAFAAFALIAALPVVRADEFASSTLSGKVIDASGQPIVGAKVWLNNFGGVIDPAQTKARAWEMTTDKNGKYELPLRYSKSDPFIAKQMYAEAKEYVRGWWDEEITLEPGKNLTVDFHLNKGEVIAGTVTVPLSPFLQSEVSPEAFA